ncbi:uncharacterized protein EMH_0052860 [Eimeria mitis]|uniref:Uncharacterized protein n=1 Tax=Eimeria mitis TaxID=44415 RepID=U6K208_9EIME|nr:uncharacterized protein EMH_0052860 [Eimeria mitis]CDJ29813.1 hypothetical protein, conserved [Eimeria mitis]
MTAVYLVLRCAVYLVNASKSRVALRFLAKAEETTRKEAGEPCTVQDDDQPEAAAGAAGVEREGEVLVKDELLERARQYVAELANLLSGNEWVFLQLDRDMRARLVAEFLCLSLVEVSALLSLLGRDERAGIEETIPSISTAIGPVYISLCGSGLTQSRRRHLKFLLSLLGSLPNVEPAASTLSMTQRLLKLKQLLELQDMALTQLKYGISALTKAVESSTEAGDDPTAAASAAKGAAAATAGATATPDLPEAPAECLLDAVVRAIELTVHRRKKQFFVDPILSAWMREVHHQKPHYGLMSTRRLSWLTQRPLKTHSELLEALRATPLGSGNVSLQQTLTEEVDAQQEAATSSAQQELSQSDRLRVSSRLYRFPDTAIQCFAMERQVYLDMYRRLLHRGVSKSMQCRTAGQEGSPEVDTWPFTSRVWGPLGTAPPVIGAGAFPTEGPEEPSHPEATSGDTQLAERLERAPDKQPGEAAPSWHPPGSSDSGS